MASLSDTLSRSLAQLRDLSFSQRLAIALGAALVAVSLIWMIQWAATPEMVPLLPGQTLATDELAQLRAGLEALGVPARVSGNTILVRAAENRAALLAQLGVRDQLPSDTSIGFDALVKEANPWISQEENNKRWTVAMQRELERVLRQLAGVKSAHVFLNLSGQRRGFTRQEPAASASLSLVMKGGEPVSRALALAAARLVAGAVRGLPLRNVEVIDGSGAVALDWESEQSVGGAGLARLRHEHEQRLTQMIRNQIGFDPALRVSVRVELDPTARESETRTPVEGVETRTSTRSQETTRGRAGEPAGVQPNVAVGSPRAGVSEQSTISESESDLATGLEHKSERTSPGEVKEIFAAINVSHGALAAIYRRANPDKGEPALEDIEAIFRVQSEKIVKQVQKLVKPQDPNQVAVEWYYEGSGSATPADAPPARSGVSLTDYVQRYGATAGLGLLALVSMVLLLRVARVRETGEAFGIEIGMPKEAIDAARHAQQAVQAAAQAQKKVDARRPAAAVGVADDEDAVVSTQAVGVAADALLEGQEVDEGMVQVMKMLEQIGKISDRDTDAVAALIEKWMDRPR
jgi:flagellar biosynthesis/type III secretory pathway M-ring protein FliF/YscJ